MHSFLNILLQKYTLFIEVPKNYPKKIIFNPIKNSFISCMGAGVV